jgi:hypothetical protein
VAFVDVTASQMLEDLRDQLEARHVGLFMAKDIGQVRDVIDHATVEDDLLARTVPTIREAIKAAKAAPGADNPKTGRIGDT